MARNIRVLARNPKNQNVVKLFRLQGGGFTRKAKHPKLAKKKPGLFTAADVKRAEKWAKTRSGGFLALHSTTSKYPFIVLMAHTAWGTPQMCRKVNRLGKRRKRYLRIGEFKRTARRQWEFRMMHLNGTGNLAARCCTRHSGKHSWEACGKNPTSNHYPGRAADIGLFVSGRSGHYIDVGRDSQCRWIMRQIGLCLPVGGEGWHAEPGVSWRA